MFGFTNLPSKAQSHPLSAKRNHTLHTIFRMLECCHHQAVRNWVCKTLVLKDFLANMKSCVSLLLSDDGANVAELTVHKVKNVAEAFAKLGSQDQYVQGVLTLLGGKSECATSFGP
jgi:hypothetical protein